MPAGGAMATTLLLRLAALTGEARYREAADRALASVDAVPRALSDRRSQLAVSRSPGGAGIDELAIAGDPESRRRPPWSTPADRPRGRRARTWSWPSPRTRTLRRPAAAGRPCDRRPPDGLPLPELRLPLPVTEPDALRDSSSRPPRRRRSGDLMATFVLIPGAGGEPWEWHRLAPELEALGHDVVAVELPAATTGGLGRVRRRRSRRHRRPPRPRPRRSVARRFHCAARLASAAC